MLYRADFKHALSEPGDWLVYMYMQGETVPVEENQISLSPDQTDPWGIPQLVIDVSYTENDERMIADFHREARVMLEKIGCRDLQEVDNQQPPGLDIHEMGGVRMGRDPQTSLLNAHNQLHHCRNVFVTDRDALNDLRTTSAKSTPARWLPSPRVSRASFRPSFSRYSSSAA